MYEVLGAKFCPDPNGGSVPTVFNGVGDTRLLEELVDLRRSRDPEISSLADFGEGTYNCLLSGTISYPKSEK